MATIALLRTMVHRSTTVPIVVVGTGTAWTPGAPGSPTFTLSGGTGASISSQVVNSTTRATLTIATGTALGALTITDPGTGATAKLYVVKAARMKYFPGLFKR